MVGGEFKVFYVDTKAWIASSLVCVAIFLLVILVALIPVKLWPLPPEVYIYIFMLAVLYKILE